SAGLWWYPSHFGKARRVPGNEPVCESKNPFPTGRGGLANRPRTARPTRGLCHRRSDSVFRHGRPVAVFLPAQDRRPQLGVFQRVLAALCHPAHLPPRLFAFLGTGIREFLEILEPARQRFHRQLHRGPFDTQWFARSVHLFGADYTLQLGTRQLVAIGVIAVFAAINCAGVMLGGRVQTALTVAKVAAIVAVAVGVFGFSDTGTWANLTPPPHQASGGLAGFGAAMFAALWAYSGWQYLPMAASEVQNPERNLPRAIIGGSLLVLALYLAVNAAYLYALPVWQVASANSTAYPEAPSVAARAVQTFLGSRAAPVAALVFLISTVGSLNGTILARARVSYASARDGLFFEPFARLSPRTRVPITSLV